MSPAEYEQKIDEVIEGGRDTLREVLRREVIVMLGITTAAVELWFEREQPDDKDALRDGAIAQTMRLVGLKDSLIEKCKEQLRTGREADSLNWRN